MMKNWRNWCRLCATYGENNNTDIFFKLEHLPDLPQIFHKYFDLMVTPYDGKPAKICDSCLDFILKIKSFTERCVKSDLVYSTLLYNLHDENDAFCIRNQIFDVDSNINYTNDEISLPKITNSNTDQWTDTNDLIDDQHLKIEPERINKKNLKRSFHKPNISYNEEEDCEVKEELEENCNDQSDDEDPEETSPKITTFSPDHNDDSSSENDAEEDKSEEVAVTTTTIEYDPEISETETKPVKKRRIKNYDGIFKCEECGQVFIKSYSYRNHLKSRHSDSKLFCTQCPKSFATRHLLKLHEKVHLPDDLKLIHPCSFCDKKFSKAINVKAHIKAVHSNERSFICDECGKGFKTKGALQEHQLTHTDDRPFQCPECPKKFKSMARLKVHNDVHTDTKYPCQICGATFQLRRSLASHMDVHTDEKKYKCDFCGNDYKRYKALKRHLASHTGFKHACSFCNKTFATSTNCKNHQKNVHPEDYAAELAIVNLEQSKT